MNGGLHLLVVSQLKPMHLEQTQPKHVVLCHAFEQNGLSTRGIYLSNSANTRLANSVKWPADSHKNNRRVGGLTTRPTLTGQTF